MTFVPRDSVRAGLDHLETRLDPIIASRLAADLQGLSWTAVLTELDRVKGKTPGHYNTRDIQCQLRVLTERLGRIGFPFDDDRRRPRYVSSLANELRIMRNAEKHNDEITTGDAWRFHDTSLRLLTHFGDETGLPPVTDLHKIAFEALVREVGIDTSASPVPELGEPSDASPEPHQETVAEQHEDELVEPDEQVLERDDPETTPTIGSTRPAYDQWVPVRLGDAEVLDSVARKANKDRVRAAATEIVEFEGPIHLDRLIALIANSFDIPRLTTRRWQKVERQVRQLGLHLDADKFLWPSNLDPKTWTEFRPNDSDAGREFLHISPVEIANARRLIRRRSPELALDGLDAATLRTFGRKRRTRAVTIHLARAAVEEQPDPA